MQSADFEALSGRGARARINGNSVIVGGPLLLTESKVAAPPEVGKVTATWASEGKTVLYVVAEERLLGAFAVEMKFGLNPLKPSRNFHRLGIRVAMITGDSKTVADSVAGRIDIDTPASVRR